MFQNAAILDCKVTIKGLFSKENHRGLNTFDGQFISSIDAVLAPLFFYEVGIKIISCSALHGVLFDASSCFYFCLLVVLFVCLKHLIVLNRGDMICLKTVGEY